MSITIIFGMPRAGKTALMTKLALDCMTGAQAAKDIRESCKEIKKFNDGGFHFTYPKRHLVFSDYDIYTRNKTLFSYRTSGYRFGLPNEKYKDIDFFPPCSRLFFDEAQKYWNSRESNKLSDFVSRAFELHGHFKLNICLAVQRVGLIDLNIRELSPNIIEVVELKHKTDNGVIMSSMWTCRVYKNVSEAEKRIAGQSARYKTKKYTFDGNIFKHYDSETFRFAFLKDRENADFDYTPNGGYDYTVKGVKRFNAEHEYTVPDGYQKGGEKKK